MASDAIGCRFDSCRVHHRQTALKVCLAFLLSCKPTNCKSISKKFFCTKQKRFAKQISLINIKHKPDNFLFEPAKSSPNHCVVFYILLSGSDLLEQSNVPFNKFTYLLNRDNTLSYRDLEILSVYRVKH